MPDTIRFRHAMGRFATGVTIVTSRRADGEPCGLTVNSFASVSLDPLLVLVCLDDRSVTHGCVLERRSFSVSVLPAGAGDLARRFSSGARGDRFEGLAVREEVTGNPVLELAVAWFDCRVHDVHPAGDHAIVVGRVLDFDRRDGRPLLFLDGRYQGSEP